MREYYKILGLNERSTQEDIKKAYRKLSKQHHPDLNPDDKGAEEKFKKISEAYEILTGKQKPKNQNPFSNYQQQNRVFKAKPLKLVIELDLEEAYHGKNKRINYNVKEPCGKCSGEGGFEPRTCNQCGGHGKVSQGPFVFMCENCTGHGKIFKTVCYSCNGRGMLNNVTHIDLQIPKGTTKDSIYTYPNIGDHIKGGIRGDVYFIIKIRLHKIYELEGLNLKRKLDIPILDILLGTEKEFETLDGKVKIKIPKLSELNKTFRLKGKGFNDDNLNVTGDMYVTLNPILPEKLNETEESKLNELKSSTNFIY